MNAIAGRKPTDEVKLKVKLSKKQSLQKLIV